MVIAKKKQTDPSMKHKLYDGNNFLFKKIPEFAVALRVTMLLAVTNPELMGFWGPRHWTILVSAEIQLFKSWNPIEIYCSILMGKEVFVEKSGLNYS